MRRVMKKMLLILLTGLLLTTAAFAGWESWSHLTSPADGDILAVQDVSDTSANASGTIKYLLLSELWDYILEKAELLFAPITQYEYVTIPIGWFADGTSPPDATDYDTRPPFSYRTFANDADEDLNVTWFVPSDMSVDTTTIQFRVKYLITESTGPTSSEGVAFGLSGVSAGDNDVTNFTKGTVVVVTDDTLEATQWDVMITDWSGDVTVSGITSGEVAELALIRDVSDTVDDYAQLVGVIAVEIRYVLEVSAP